MDHAIENEYKDAHKQGFNDGINGIDNLYIIAINDYHREYNRGYKAGASLSS